MVSKAITLVLLVALLCCGVHAKEWKVIAPSLGSVLMGVSFTDPQTGYVSGSSSQGSLLLQTTNGGANWTNQASGSTMFMSVSSESPKVSAAAGMSLLNGNVDHYTQDGQNWFPSEQRMIFTACMDSESLGNGVFHFYGQFTSLTKKCDGMAVSTNGGRNSTMVSYSAKTSARYGSFVSPQVGYIAGGSWPETTASSKRLRDQGARLLSARLLVDQSGVMHAVHALDDLEKRTDIDPAWELWKNVIQKTTDGGATWTTVVNETSVAGLGGYYPNGLSFVDENNGWSAQEGNAASGEMHARIQHTSDGGRTWDTQYSCVDCSLFRVVMADANFGFAVGGIRASYGFDPLILNTQDGGQTWNVDDGELTKLYVNNVAILSNGDAYATAFTPYQTSSVLAFN